MWLTRLSVYNPYFAAVLVLTMVVLGVFNIFKLPVEAFPDVRFPVAVVSTSYEGASPEVVESEVSRPLEEAVNTINGIKNIRSYSMEGVSTVVAEFELATNADKAVQDVRDKVGMAAGSFRREISTPVVAQFDPNDSAMLEMSLSSNETSARALTDWINNTLKKRLQTVMGVGEVYVVGGAEREINIALKPEKLQSYGLNIGDVQNALARSNSDFPSGTVSNYQGELSVRVAGKIKDPMFFANVVVAKRDNTLIRVQDVATVTDGIAEMQSVSLLNGKPAIAVNIRATRGANVVDVSDGVKAMMAEELAKAPKGVGVEYIYDQADDIRTSVSEVRDTLVEGVVLTVLIVFIFLGTWRSTVITGLTLPVSLIGCMFALSLMGFTINLMTLMALSLSIGLLIDDAIVVRENIMRHVVLGKSHFDAALEGTKEIGLAVLATSLCIVAVFLPIGYMDGIIGKFFHQFGLTVAAAIVISTVVSLTLDPMLSSIWHDPARSGKRSMIGRAVDRFDVWLERVAERYQVWLKWTLRHKAVVLITATVLTVASFGLVVVGQVGGEFMPQEDRGKLELSFKTATGSSLEDTVAKTQEIEVILKKLPELKSLTTNIGKSSFGSGKNESQVIIDVGKKQGRERSINVIADEVREALSRVAGIEITALDVMGQAGPPGKPVNVGLRGSNIQDLNTAAKQIEVGLQKIAGVQDVQNSEADADPALNIVLDRDAAARLGVDLPALGDTMQTLFAGKDATVWEAADGNGYNVRLQVPKNVRNQTLLESITVPSVGADGQSKMIALSNIARIESGVSPRQVNRINLQREITITANIVDRNYNDVYADIETLKSKIVLPDGINIVNEGHDKEMAESAMYALQALLMGVIFIYLILTAQFRSFTLPITIMMSLPLIFIGVFVALWISGNTLNMFSIIGIVMLMGLAAKNGILLVDFINHARLNESMDRFEAILEAGRVRLRPIVMTSLAMIFGMIPLAVGMGEGSESRSPMAWAVIGGLITSTVLTLFVVPVVYVLMDNFRQWMHRVLHRLNRTPTVDKTH